MGVNCGRAYYRCRVSDRVYAKLRARANALREMAATALKPSPYVQQQHAQAETMRAQADVLEDVAFAINQANDEVADEGSMRNHGRCSRHGELK
jgi:hypothetical protein